MPSNFEFLRDEWPALFESAVRCEVAVRSDPRAACFYARLTLESAAFWLYEVEGSLQLPYESTLNAMLHEPTFKTLVPTPVFYKAKQVKDLGNKAAHKGRSPSPQDSMMAVKDLFHVMYWVAANYSRQQRPEGGCSSMRRWYRQSGWWAQSRSPNCRKPRRRPPRTGRHSTRRAATMPHWPRN